MPPPRTLAFTMALEYVGPDNEQRYVVYLGETVVWSDTRTSYDLDPWRESEQAAERFAEALRSLLEVA